MADKLEVQIGAEIKELQSKLKDAEGRLSKFTKNADKDLSKLGKNSTSAAKGVTKLGKGAANAVPAMNEFSRVIQDAPFGIQGIANNITQLTQNFGYLKAKTGSTSSAFKAMAATLTGPAGILLAISAVTSLLVAYGDEISEVISGNNKLANSQKAVNEALTEFYGNQISKVNSYISILDNVNTSEEQRKNITNELIKIVPNLTKEDFKYGNNLDIVRGKIGDYVLAQASRIEADTIVQENSKKLSSLAQANQIKSIKDQKKRIEAFTKFLKDNGERVNKEITTSSYKVGGGKITVKKTQDEIVETFNKFTSDLETELKPVQDKINQLYSTTFSGGLGGGKGKGKTTKPVFIEELKANAKEIKNSILEVVDIGSIESDREFLTIDWEEYYNLKQLDLVQQKLLAFNMGAKNIIQEGIANTFSLLGESIGNGTLNAAQAISRGLGGILSAMGDYLIKAGTAAVLAGTIAKLFGSIEGIGVGLAAIAGGVVLKGIGSSISNFQGAGNNTGSTNAGTTSNGGGASFSGGSSVNTGLQNVVFEIQGTKLVGVISNTLKRNRNLGGNLSFG